MIDSSVRESLEIRAWTFPESPCHQVRDQIFRNHSRRWKKTWEPRRYGARVLLGYRRSKPRGGIMSFGGMNGESGCEGRLTIADLPQENVDDDEQREK